RPHRLRGARLGLRTPGPAQQPGTDRGLPPGAVLDGRNADLPGRDRPTDAVHRTGGTLPAAVRAQRTGAPPSSPLPGSLTEVLPAGRLLLRVLPDGPGAAVRLLRVGTAERTGQRRTADRSEEHTSELQSRFDLVCRLLLEKQTHR